MPSQLTQFAAEAAGKSDMLSSLGIDWRLFLFQVVAFGILVFALGKWVFPVFFQIIDKRQAAIEEGNRAAVEATKHAEKAQAEIAKLLTEARTEAKDIVATAKQEADDMLNKADEKAKVQADHLVAQAHESIAKDVIAAKKALHNETVDLVAAATAKVVGKTVDAQVDKTLIKEALK